MSNSKFIGGEFPLRVDAGLTNSSACRPAGFFTDGLKGGALELGTIPLDFESGRSGLMTWLHASERGHRRDKAQPLLMIERMGLFPSSGEISRKVKDPLAVLERIKALHADLALEIDEAEGLRLVLSDWRCKLRVSPMESGISLWVESRGDIALMQAKTDELLEQIDGKRTERAGL